MFRCVNEKKRIRKWIHTRSKRETFSLYPRRFANARVIYVRDGSSIEIFTALLNFPGCTVIAVGVLLEILRIESWQN